METTDITAVAKQCTVLFKHLPGSLYIYNDLEDRVKVRSLRQQEVPQHIVETAGSFPHFPLSHPIPQQTLGHLGSLISTPSSLCRLKIQETRAVFACCAVSPRKGCTGKRSVKPANGLRSVWAETRGLSGTLQGGVARLE